jgi:uncharacterized membrane protein YdbT with pleckstrin-like domain
MPYPQDSLHPSEDLILDLHPHWWYFAKSAAAGVVAVVIALVVLAQGWDWAKIPVALFLLAALVWFLERYIRWISTHFVLTSDRVIYRSGVIAKRGIEIPLERINTIFFHQRIFERMLGLGDLEIESASKDGAQRFDDIKNPSAVQNEIYQQMESNEVKQANRISGAINTAYSAQAQAPQVAQPAPNVADQIQQLAMLRDQGHITPEEFEAKKAELLGRM